MSPPVDPGLCGVCREAHVIRSGRGSEFWRCRVHDREPAWPKYPRLPVRGCPRFAAGEAARTVEPGGRDPNGPPE